MKSSILKENSNGKFNKYNESTHKTSKNKGKGSGGPNGSGDEPNDFFVFDDFLTNREKRSMSLIEEFIITEQLCVEVQEAAVNVVDVVGKILAIKERTPVKLDFKKRKTFKKFVFNEKVLVRDYNKATMAFNKVSRNTVQKFVDELLSLNIQTVKEMKKLAKFFFDKAVREDLHVNTYVEMLKTLRKSFVCKEEKSRNANQTCFFGSILVLIDERIKENHVWNGTKKIDFANKTDSEISREREENELDRLYVKKNAIGTMRLVMLLYKESIIGMKTMDRVINFLMTKTTTEHIEMLSFIVRLGPKTFYQSHPDIYMKILNYCKDNYDTNDIRMGVVVKDSIKEFEDCTNKKIESTPVKEKEVSIDDMVDDIAKDVSVFSSGLEAGDLADSIKKRVNRVKDKKEFWLEYLYVSVTHTKSASKLCELFSRHLVPICKQNLNLTNNFISFLKEFKEEVSSFRDSEPVSKKKYPELLCYLKADKKITDSEFEGLKFDDFNDQIIFLFKKWKSQNDQRLMLFVSKDKFDSI